MYDLSLTVIVFRPITADSEDITRALEEGDNVRERNTIVALKPSKVEVNVHLKDRETVIIFPATGLVFRTILGIFKIRTLRRWIWKIHHLVQA